MPAPVAGDHDVDGDFDPTDWRQLVGSEANAVIGCFSGPRVDGFEERSPLDPCLRAFDIDADFDLELSDIAGLVTGISWRSLRGRLE